MVIDWDEGDLIETAFAVSTNDDCFELLKSREFCLLWTMDQRSGRGTRGRTWHLPPGKGLALSIGVRTPPFPSPLTLCYPLLAGLVVLHTLRDLTNGPSLSLKWPNDVLADGSKLAGILCESRKVDNSFHVVLGIGINLKPDPVLDALPKGYATINEWPQPPSPRELTTRIAAAFSHTLSTYPDMASICDAWLRFASVPVGRMVAVESGDRTYRGRFVGLSEDGGLVLENETGGKEVLRQSADVIRELEN